jgi:molecular chaperone GrpE
MKRERKQMKNEQEETVDTKKEEETQKDKNKSAWEEKVEESMEKKVVSNEEGEEDNGEKDSEEEPDPLKVLVDQLGQVEEQKKDLEEKFIRLVAEFDNYKKRMSRDFERQSEMVREKILLSILPVMDDLDRLLQHEEENEDVSLEGIKLIRNNFERVLNGYGVKPFNSVGAAFDPEKHDAMMTRQSDEHKVPTVVEEFEKGYMINDKVLRHARVVVSAAE